MLIAQPWLVIELAYGSHAPHDSHGVESVCVQHLTSPLQLCEVGVVTIVTK